MRHTTLFAFILAILACWRPAPVLAAEAAPGLTPEQALGRMLYSEKDLSLNRNQSCQSCHHPDAGFADPKNAADPFRSPVSEGTNPGMFGGRNSPTAAYAAYSPSFAWVEARRGYVGGQFWDGRASTLQEQACGPPMNPVEMAMPSKDVAGARLAARPEYVQAFKNVYGVDPAMAPPQEVFERMAQAIAAYERSPELCSFSSKFDAWLAGQASLNRMELMGYRFFLRAGCANCHSVQPGRAPDGSAVPPLFTDYSYHNLGLPKNLALPGGASAPPDLGLGGVEAVKAADPEGLQRGRFKVPTLRNVARTAPYGHNGVFRNLEEVVWFYNTRDMLPACPEGGAASARPCWRAPEVAENVNRTDMGRLGMCRMQVRGIVAFLNTLTDGWMRPGVAMNAAYRP